ncbi:hypothetical protein CGZ95_16265 [Enemella evansiae]|uniref:HXXEE domain-containing protein n=1 Tax=Enemella evansiae TaxID=2016499 RepID=UPI000B974DA1|nr:HXXEE domain-containing protein [Enemella evansiae]OYN95297.1 hypothetical protein CGZ95_16265 [Enemella evansiae]
MGSNTAPAAPAVSAPPGRLVRGAPFLLPYLVYVTHTLEELPGFAAWATKFFGPESTGTFATYHIPLMLLVLLASVQAIRTGHRAWIVLATAFQWQFGVNALFHLTTWIMLGDYSPGAVTAAVVSIPATAFFLCWVRREQRATGRELALAIAIGSAIAGLAIGFLFL